MSILRYTLLADGTSDQVLMFMIDWTLRQQGVLNFKAQWADLWRAPRPPRRLPERIVLALEYYPCDLLFIHRDAENIPRTLRRAEIEHALQDVARQVHQIPAIVSIIPVRMQEAWLLFDEQAIRHAADNPNGRQALALPRLSDIENLPDPKDILNKLGQQASGLHGRRLHKFSFSTYRLAELIDDFGPLRSLSAFQVFEQDLREVLDTHGWRDE